MCRSAMLRIAASLGGVTAGFILAERVPVAFHEAGHVVVGYLAGLPVDAAAVGGDAAVSFGEPSDAAVGDAVDVASVVSMAGIAGEVNLGRIVTQNIRLQGVTVGSRQMFENMVRALEMNQIAPVIDETATFAFEDVGQALAALPNGKHFGKVVCEF